MSQPSSPVPSRIPPDPRHEAAALLRLGQHVRAREIYRQLVRTDAQPPDLLMLARIHLSLGETDAATECLQQAARFPSLPAQLADAIAAALFETGNVEDSLALLTRVAADEPDNPDLRFLLGQALSDVGRRDDAIAAFQAALRLRPRWAAALGELLNLARGNAEPAWLEDGAALLADDRIPAEERAILGYGLGRAFEAHGQPDRAFPAWAQANRLRRSIHGGLDRAAARRHTDQITGFYNADTLARPVELVRAGPRPVFIVGMPRSGTTLLEQMLSAHPEVAAFGELPTMGRIFSGLHSMVPLAAGRPDRSLSDHVPVAALQKAVDTYLGELARRSRRHAPIAIDKAPMNYLRVGLISLLFPDAKVIICQRDPRDVCVSIFSESFGRNHTFATDLGDLAFYYREHERMLAHWTRALPGRVRTLRYEELVDSPETQLRSLSQWLDLPWTDAILNHHERADVILTPSKWQVRSPIYRTSIHRWKKFHAHIQPLLDEFGDAADPAPHRDAS